VLDKPTLASLKQVLPSPLAGGLGKARDSGGLQVGLAVTQQPATSVAPKN